MNKQAPEDSFSPAADLSVFQTATHAHWGIGDDTNTSGEETKVEVESLPINSYEPGTAKGNEFFSSSDPLTLFALLAKFIEEKSIQPNFSKDSLCLEADVKYTPIVFDHKGVESTANITEEFKLTAEILQVKEGLYCVQF